MTTGEFFWGRGKKGSNWAVELTAMATGAFAAMSIIELIPSEEMLQRTKAAASLKDTYRAPNQAKIDRMFLDELPPQCLQRPVLSIQPRLGDARFE